MCINGGNIQVKFETLLQNDFITGSLAVGGAEGILAPLQTLIEADTLWDKVAQDSCYCKTGNKIELVSVMWAHHYQ